MLDHDMLLKIRECIEQKSKFGCEKCNNFKNECPAYEKELIETTLKLQVEKMEFIDRIKQRIIDLQYMINSNQFGELHQFAHNYCLNELKNLLEFLEH